MCAYNNCQCIEIYYYYYRVYYIAQNFGGYGGSLPIFQSFIRQKVARSCELKY